MSTDPTNFLITLMDMKVSSPFTQGSGGSGRWEDITTTANHKFTEYFLFSVVIFEFDM